MKIAYTFSPDRGATDLLLADVANTLLAGGVKVCGSVQINTQPEDDTRCDMDVRVLPNGPVIRISQSLGRGSRGCRLDPESLERAVGLVEGRLDEDAEVLIINKFGKHEAQGRGFREVIAKALLRGIPVLVGLNRVNEAAFRAFSADMAVELPPVERELIAWVRDRPVEAAAS